MRLWDAGTSAGEAAVRIEGREHLLKYVADKLRLRGLTITDDMIHFRPCGAPHPFAGAGYAVMVDRFGLFGFADQPCADDLDAGASPWRRSEQGLADQVDKAFDVPAPPAPKQD